MIHKHGLNLEILLVDEIKTLMPDFLVAEET